MDLTVLRRAVALFAGIVAIAACGDGHSVSEKAKMRMDDSELIVLAAPRDGDPYYGDFADAIHDFHVDYAKAIIDSGDDVLIFVDQASYARYADTFDSRHLVIAPMDDIWMRDFSPSNADAPVMFRYTAEGQGGGARGQRDADSVQDTLAALLERAGVSFDESDLFNDGGNFVEDGNGRAIVSRKFLRDNGLTEADGRAALRGMAGVRSVAFIDADEQGGLEHADGVALFIAPNVVVVNAYPDDPDYAAALHADLRAGLPGVEIHEIVAPYDGGVIHDDRFGSACGLYVNMLVTPKRIYLPQFGVPEDRVAFAALAQWTKKEIVPVPSAGVCPMGGGVRCMSQQLRGADAQKLLRWARAPK